MDRAALRLFDANANRAVEGLRVAEDVVRLGLDDAELSAQLKHLRHDLQAAMGRVAPAMARAAARDIEGDVGTGLSTPAEGQRASLGDLALGAFGRTKEAVRVLEEVAKLRSADAAMAIEQIRYRLYAVEQQALLRLDRVRRLHDARLYLLLSARLCGGDLPGVLSAALRGGVDVVQLREKDLSKRQYLALARDVHARCREAGVPFVVNDHADVAVALEADGVHLGQDDLPPSAARRIVGPRMLIGYSTHSLGQLQSTEAVAADYLGVGPAWPTSTKPHEPQAGLAFIDQAARHAQQPWFAIGGVTPERLPELVAHGARRIAVSSAVCGAEDPEAISRALKQALPPDAAKECNT